MIEIEAMFPVMVTSNLDAVKQFYEAAFDTLISLPMPEDVYLNAALLRARFRVRTPDALHLSCAQYHRCNSFWTNDDRLVKAGHGLVANVCTD